MVETTTDTTTNGRRLPDFKEQCHTQIVQDMENGRNAASTGVPAPTGAPTASANHSGHTSAQDVGVIIANGPNFKHQCQEVTPPPAQQSEQITDKDDTTTSTLTGSTPPIATALPIAMMEHPTSSPSSDEKYSFSIAKGSIIKCLLVIIGLFILVGIVVGGVCGAGLCSSDSGGSNNNKRSSKNSNSNNQSPSNASPVVPTPSPTSAEPTTGVPTTATPTGGPTFSPVTAASFLCSTFEGPHKTCSPPDQDPPVNVAFERKGACASTSSQWRDCDNEENRESCHAACSSLASSEGCCSYRAHLASGNNGIDSSTGKYGCLFYPGSDELEGNGNSDIYGSVCTASTAPLIRHVPDTYCDDYYSEGGDGDCTDGKSFSDVWSQCEEDGIDICMGVMWNSCEGPTSDTTVNGAWKLMTAGQEISACRQGSGHWDVFVRAGGSSATPTAGPPPTTATPTGGPTFSPLTAAPTQAPTMDDGKCQSDANCNIDSSSLSNICLDEMCCMECRRVLLTSVFTNDDGAGGNVEPQFYINDRQVYPINGGTGVLAPNTRIDFSQPLPQLGNIRPNNGNLAFRAFEKDGGTIFDPDDNDFATIPTSEWYRPQQRTPYGLTATLGGWVFYYSIQTECCTN